MSDVDKTSWTDAKGSRWVCRVTIAEARRLRAEDGIDLLDPDALSKVVADPFEVVLLLVRIHADQWTEAGLTEGDFAELCTETEQVSQDAADALTAGLVAFFRRLRKPALAAVVGRAAEAAAAVEKAQLAKVESRGGAVVAAAVQRANVELEKAMDAALAGKPYGTPPVS